jgi:hypothetical protein
VFAFGHQVFQRIDVVSKDFDNIVDVELGAPWPLPPVELTATLAHKFEIIGESLFPLLVSPLLSTATPNGPTCLVCLSLFLITQS